MTEPAGSDGPSTESVMNMQLHVTVTMTYNRPTRNGRKTR